jgi:hypothetical protein
MNSCFVTWCPSDVELNGANRNGTVIVVKPEGKCVVRSSRPARNVASSWMMRLLHIDCVQSSGLKIQFGSKSLTKDAASSKTNNLIKSVFSGAITSSVAWKRKDRHCKYDACLFFFKK